MPHQAAALGRPLVLLIVILCAVTASRADVIKLLDGRTYEGEIIAETSAVVSLDTMVGPTIRTTIRFARDEIDTMERQPLPPGFFDPPPAPVREPDAASAAPDTTLYLEVPVRGRFGDTVFADGIGAVLRYAKRHRVPHIVFVIDSDGGQYEEAQATYKLLEKHSNALTYHAIVQKCTGGALAVGVSCDTVHLLPGATLGGNPAPAESASGAMSIDQEMVMRSQVANEVARNMERRGRRGEIVRAMIDPAAIVAAWKSSSGEVVVGELVPQGTGASSIIFQDGPDSVLVLDEEQAAQLGVARFEGGAAELGARLEIAGWTRESSYGRDTMAETVEKKRIAASEARVAHTDAVRTNIGRRELAERYIEENLRQAAEWSPEKANYSTYSRRWRWGWGDSYRRREGGTWTQESQERWRVRSDLTMNFLTEAARGVSAMVDLDREAIELGLEPTFAPGELEMMARDINTKGQYVAANRNRRRG